MSPAVKSQLQENLQLLRPALLAAAALGLVALAAGSYAAMRWSTHQQRIAAAEQAQDAALQARRAARSDAELLARIGTQYQALAARGAVDVTPIAPIAPITPIAQDGSAAAPPAKTAGFDRMQALDRFEAALQMSSAGPAVDRYALAKAQALPEGSVPNLQQLGLVRHALSFEASPLHEEDFLRLWQRVNKDVGGLHALEQCSLQRPDEVGLSGAATALADSGNAPRLRARCTLAWYVFINSADAAQLQQTQ